MMKFGKIKSDGDRKISLSNDLALFSGDRKPMLFDLLVGGHHGAYIQHLIKHLDAKRFPKGINIVVSPLFLERHADIVEMAAQRSTTIHFIAISLEESSSLNPSSSGYGRSLRMIQEWRLMSRYARLLQATHCLIMYFDTCWLPITLGMKLPCPFSGIYFRPTLHYQNFSHYIPSKNERVQQVREKFVLTRILKHPQLQALLTLDQFAIKYIQQIIKQVRSQVTVLHLPDPIQIDQSSSMPKDLLKQQLGITSDKKVFLLFGVLNERKGIDQLLEAIRLLPPDLCQQLCLVLLGAGDANHLGAKVASICQSQPIQVIEQYHFLPDQEVRAYFELADIVIATYQRHVGMSGILLWAAAVQKPVLSTDYGLMGELVRHYHLGLTVDSASPEAIAQGLTQCLLEPTETLGDRDQMKIFAQQNSAEKFADVIFRNLSAFESQ